MVDSFHTERTARLALAGDRIDVWTFRTDKAGFSLPGLQSVLSVDELERADRFRTDRLRRGFILSRGLLRILCSRYLACDPAALVFEYGAKGKPALGPDCGLGFNVSHSGALLVLAFAWNLELGIDVEEVRPLSEIEAVAHRFFCAEETSEVLSHRGATRTLLFHTCWTRKEAFIKATGDGLSMSLDHFRVTLRADVQAHIVHVNFDEREAAQWTLQALELPGPYVGALCYRGVPRSVQMAAF